jgi:hypothetical protein
MNKSLKDCPTSLAIKENENQNYTEIPFHLIQNGSH